MKAKPKKDRVFQSLPNGLRRNVSYDGRLMTNKDFIDTLILKDGFIFLTKSNLQSGQVYILENSVARKFRFKNKSEKEYIDTLMDKIMEGAKVEMEHKGTIEAIKKPGIKTKDAAAMIAADHIAEKKDYYNELDKAKLEQGGPIQQPTTNNQQPITNNQQIKEGATLQGPSHAKGGIEIQVNKKPVAEAEGGEVVINAENSKLFCEELSEINQRNGNGKAFNCDENCDTCDHKMECGGKLKMDITGDEFGEEVEIMARGSIINKRMKFPKTYKEQAGKYGTIKKEEVLSDYQTNKAIEKMIDAKGIDSANYTSDEKQYLRKYSGYGGIVADEFSLEEAKASFTEFYTPDTIVRKMWALAYKYGFKDGGNVLEPSVGTGEFLKYMPSNSMATGYEINKYSYSICKILYPQYNFYLQPFENVFIKNRDTLKNKINDLPKYSLVIGNPPYGDVSGIGMGMGEKQYTNAKNWIEYFILRGLDLTLPGGLLIYIIGTEVANGGTPFLQQGTNKVKEKIAERADLVDAYRLPNGVFDRTDVLSDILVFKKK